MDKTIGIIVSIIAIAVIILAVILGSPTLRGKLFPEKPLVENQDSSQNNSATPTTSIDSKTSIDQTSSTNEFSQGATNGSSSIMVLSPNNGEIWQVNNRQEIKWIYSGINMVYIYLLFPDEGECLLAQRSASDRLYSFDLIPSLWCANTGTHKDVVAGQYKALVKGELAGGSYIQDKSDQFFSVTAQPSITIKYPNGGEVLYIGKLYNLSWSTDLKNTGLKIQLLKNENVLKTLITLPYSYNPASFWLWTVPDNLESGSDYKIKIIATDYPENYIGKSKKTFSIVNY